MLDLCITLSGARKSARPSGLARERDLKQAGGKLMPFTGTRQDVANVVIEAIRAFQGDNSIVENTAFGLDLIVDKGFRRNWASPILQLMSARFPEAVLSSFGPNTCANAGKVKDIVDAIWTELKP
jgi:hypothetical protein